jgi:lia operon protein LiaG
MNKINIHSYQGREIYGIEEIIEPRAAKMKSKLKAGLIGISALVVIGVLISMSISLSMGPALFKKIDQEKRFEVAGIAEIQVALSSTPVNIIRTDSGPEVRFHYYGRALQTMDLVAEISNQTLAVSARRQYLFLGSCEDMNLEVFIPGDYSQKLTLITSSGLIRLDSFDLAGLTLKTTSGGLQAESLQAANIVIQTTSGKLNIGSVAADRLEISGASSSINIDSCRVKDTAVKVSSGRINLKNSRGNLDLQGTSGSVRIACQEFGDQNIKIKTTSGNVELALPGTAEFSVEARMTSGKFQSDFPIGAAGDKDQKNIVAQIGKTGNQISLQTTSGNINLTKIANLSSR